MSFLWKFIRALIFPRVNAAVNAVSIVREDEDRVILPEWSNLPGYERSSGIVWLTPGTQNNLAGNPDDPDAAIPFLHEQANVVATLIKNADSL